MKNLTFWKFLTPAILATIFSLYLFLGKIDSHREPLFDIPHKDKIVHMVIFGGLTFLYYVGLKKQKTYNISEKLLIRSLVIGGLFYALFTEWAQMTFTTYRNGDIWDVVADLTGVIIAIFISKKLVGRFL